MTMKEDFPDRDAPLRAPNERELHDNTLLVSLNPTSAQTILSPSALRQVVPRKKALFFCMFSFVVLSAHSTVALPARGNTSYEESNTSPRSVLKLTKSAKAGIGPHNWNQLSSRLSEGAFQVSKTDDWLTQCIHPLADRDLSKTLEHSVYQLIEEPSGMCMAHANCAYKACEGPFSSPQLVWPFTYSSAEYTDESLKKAKGLDLPDATVHPIHVGDISEAIKVAAAEKIEVSVKTSGHSYTGASTKRGSILLNLSKLKKYSPDGSIVECHPDHVLEGASEQSCNLALARDKPAFIRVGGGEIWDETLQAVYFAWNENTDNSNKYHIVTGGAGCVSSAGGWLASGGLSGNNDMRSYGIGIDQVLHVEMVLPSGVHVRFGPTDWEINTDMIYPRTTTVTGYCNKGDLQNEDKWAWEKCNKKINFDDLWYAVRGGGGGSYGVVTSIYYQLHEYSPLQLVIVNPELLANGTDELQKLWIEFVLKFFFSPSVLESVPESASNHCSTTQEGGFKGGKFQCYNEAGSVMKKAWDTFSLDLNGAADIVSVDNSYESWAAQGLLSPRGNSGDPTDRLFSAPSAVTTNQFEGVVQFMMFPENILITKTDDMVTMIFNYLSNAPSVVRAGTMYVMGGKIPAADDGMNSLPPHRRHGGFLMVVFDPIERTKFSRFFNNIGEDGAWSGKSFPGALCHNHVSLDFATPQKEDWALSCDPAWNKEEKEEKCLSFQETAWGTDILAKLERIHSSVDPDGLFNPDDGVGYARTGKKSSKKDKSEETKKVKQVKKTKSGMD